MFTLPTPAQLPGDGPAVVPGVAKVRSAWSTFKLGIVAVLAAQAVSAGLVSVSAGHSFFAPIGQALKVMLVGPAAVESTAATVALEPTRAAPAPSGPAPAPRPAFGRLSAREIAAHARAAGFRGEPLVTAVAVSLAESGGRPGARCYNTGHGCSRRPSSSTRSTDRGLWQINDHAHPGVSTACADDPACAARAAYRISRGGASFRPWTTYKHGTAWRHLREALTAVLGREPTAAELAAAGRAEGAAYRAAVGPLPMPVQVASGEGR